MQAADLKKMTVAARVAAMEALWDSLSHDPDHDPSPAWHAVVLAKRRQELTQAKARPWDEAKLDLRALGSRGRPDTSV